MELALELFYDPAECPGKEAPVSLSEWRQEVLLCFLGQTEWPSSFKITLGITEVCPRAGGAWGREVDHQARACRRMELKTLASGEKARTSWVGYWVRPGGPGQIPDRKECLVWPRWALPRSHRKTGAQDELSHGQAPRPPTPMIHSAEASEWPNPPKQERLRKKTKGGKWTKGWG